MMARARQAGEGKAGCIFWILLFAVASLVAFKMIPIRIQVAQLADYMDEQATFGHRAGADKLRKAIVNKARDLDLPIKQDQVKVSVARGRVRMDVKFMVPVEFPGYTYEWNFDLQLDKPIFQFN